LTTNGAHSRAAVGAGLGNRKNVEVEPAYPFVGVRLGALKFLFGQPHAAAIRAVMNDDALQLRLDQRTTATRALHAARRSVGTPSIYATCAPLWAGTVAPGTMMPTRFSGSVAFTTTRSWFRGVRRIRASCSTAPGSANCSPLKPLTNLPPRTSPRSSMR